MKTYFTTFENEDDKEDNHLTGLYFKFGDEDDGDANATITSPNAQSRQSIGSNMHLAGVVFYPSL